jgi:hypothetical protein
VTLSRNIDHGKVLLGLDFRRAGLRAGNYLLVVQLVRRYGEFKPGVEPVYRSFLDVEPAGMESR